MSRASVPIAVAVVQREGHVLIGQRGAGVHLAGLWEFPGGKIQPRESAAEAAVRECREETGLEIEALGTHSIVEHVYAADPADPGRSEARCVRLHFITCRPRNLSAIPTAPFRWIPLKELAQYEFPAANAVLIADLIEQASQESSPRRHGGTEKAT